MKSIRSVCAVVTLLCLTVLSVPVSADSPSAAPAGADREDRRWEVTGPFGGSVRTLAIAPDDANRIYIGTTDGQLYRSRDGGNTWARAVPGFNKPGMVLENLLIDPVDSNIMYLGVWAADNNRVGGIFKSTDSGDTWKELDDMHNESVRALAFDPNDSKILVAGTLKGVFRSTDGGKDWDLISPENHADLANFNSVAIDPRDSNIIYAGTTHLPWKTTDCGKNWFSIKDGMIDDSDVFSIAILDENPDLVFASACSGIYRSETAGQKWTKVQGIPFTSRRTRIIFPHPSREGVVFAGTTQGLWRTMDGGKTWQIMTPKTLVVNAIDVHPSQPDKIILGTDNHGVLVSNDLGAKFLESNVGFIHRHVLAVVPDVAQPNRVYSTVFHDGVAGGFFISNDGGRSWRQSIKGLGGRDVFALYQDPDAPETLWAGTNYGVYRSKNRGDVWAFVGKPAKPVKKTPPKRGRRGARAAVDTGEEIAVVAVAQRSKKGSKRSTRRTPAPKKPAGPPLLTIEEQVNGFSRYVDAEGVKWMLAVTSRGLYKSTDPDKGWLKIETPGLAAPFSAISTEVADPDRTIYLGTMRGVAMSNDFGQTWSRVNRGPDEMPIKSIAQDPREPRNVYVGARGYFYKSSDGGRSWRKRGGGLPAGDITVVAVDPQNPDILYAGDYGSGGFYRSRNQGEEWERLDAGLPSARMWSIAPDPFEPSRIYAGSFSGGVYILTVNAPAAMVSH
jgi:photosystem II stability/assembly factor-like uncharacterized protein